MQEQFLSSLLSRHQTLQATYLNIWRRVAIKLSQPRVSEAYKFGDIMMSDEQVLKELINLKNKMFLFAYYLANGILMYFKREFVQACYYLDNAASNASGVVGMATNSLHSFYYSLALLGTIVSISALLLFIMISCVNICVA